MGLAIPLTVGAALIGIVLITLASDMYKAPSDVDAGSIEDYTIGTPEQFPDEEFWLVRLGENEFVALYDRDPVTGCALVWGPEHTTLGRTGWFRDSCSGAAYDLTGACFDGPCDIGLNRYELTIENGLISVNPREGSRGLLRSENGEPVNPPR
jgi:nitrite reductase/ring-hydroxylating ferredoxin subunit